MQQKSYSGTMSSLMVEFFSGVVTGGEASMSIQVLLVLAIAKL